MLPAGDYAVLPVTCRPVELNSKWNWLTSSWLPQSGQVLGMRPGYELFAPPPGMPVRAEFGARLCLSLGEPVRQSRFTDS